MELSFLSACRPLEQLAQVTHICAHAYQCLAPSALAACSTRLKLYLIQARPACFTLLRSLQNRSIMDEDFFISSQESDTRGQKRPRLASSPKSPPPSGRPKRSFGKKKAMALSPKQQKAVAKPASSPTPMKAAKGSPQEKVAKGSTKEKENVRCIKCGEKKYRKTRWCSLHRLSYDSMRAQAVEVNELETFNKAMLRDDSALEMMDEWEEKNPPSKKFKKKKHHRMGSLPEDLWPAQFRAGPQQGQATGQEGVQGLGQVQEGLGVRRG